MNKDEESQEEDMKQKLSPSPAPFHKSLIKCGEGDITSEKLPQTSVVFQMKRNAPSHFPFSLNIAFFLTVVALKKNIALPTYYRIFFL